MEANFHDSFLVLGILKLLQSGETCSHDGSISIFKWRKLFKASKPKSWFSRRKSPSYPAGFVAYIQLKHMIWFVIIIYVAIIALGCMLLWVAYQVGFCKRYTWIREGGKPVPLEQAVETAKPLAVLAAISGVAMIAFAIAIPIAQIRFGTWQFYSLVIASLAGVVRHFTIWNYRRRRALTD